MTKREKTETENKAAGKKSKAAAARRRGRTISDLVREALELVYGSPHTADRLATLRGIAGLWRDRDDLGDTAGYVRRLRRDTRKGRTRRT